MPHEIGLLQNRSDGSETEFSTLSLIPPAPPRARQRQFLVADRRTLAKDPDFAAELLRQSDVVVLVGEEEAAALAASLPAEVVAVAAVYDLKEALEGITTNDSVVLAVEDTERVFELVKDVLRAASERTRLDLLERQIKKVLGRLGYLEEHFSWSAVSQATGLNLAPSCVLCGRAHGVGPCAA